jgi:tellurite methyltransferase
MIYPELKHTDIYLLDLLMKRNFRNGAKVLDAGCGSGRNIPVLIKSGLDVYAIDPDKLRLKQTVDLVSGLFPDYPVQKFACKKIEDLESRPNYDLVVCSAVLHFAADELQFTHWMTKLSEILLSEGLLFIRLVTSHTLCNMPGPFHCKMDLPDGTNRFVADKRILVDLTKNQLNLHFEFPLKTVNVDYKRTMTTLILSKSGQIS